MKFTTSRYFRNKILKDSNNNQYLNSWTKTNIQELFSKNDIFLKMGPESRLDIIASSYLGNDKYWWIIAMINEMKHFWDWKAGDVLRIPTDVSKFMSFIQNNVNK